MVEYASIDGDKQAMHANQYRYSTLSWESKDQDLAWAALQKDIDDHVEQAPAPRTVIWRIRPYVEERIGPGRAKKYVARCRLAIPGVVIETREGLGPRSP